MNKFYNDLEFGQKYELLLTQLIVNDGYQQFKNKDYDIMLKNGDEIVYYEVKADKITKNTGNICIEFQCNNKCSGISTTKANYYAYFEVLDDDKYNLYKIPVQKIKKRINEKKYKRIWFGGDNKKSKFYLFNKEIFKKYLIISNNE